MIVTVIIVTVTLFLGKLILVMLCKLILISIYKLFRSHNTISNVVSGFSLDHLVLDLGSINDLDFVSIGVVVSIFSSAQGFN